MMEGLLRLFEFGLLLIANIAIGALGFIPSILITPVNLDRFGLAGGSALSVSGEIIGALFGFWLYRYGAKHISSTWQQQRWFRFFCAKRMPLSSGRSLHSACCPLPRPARSRQEPH